MLYTYHCSDEGVGLLGVVSPGGRERLNVAVVAGESVDARLNENKSELGILVLSELFQMLSDCDRLLDQVVEVLRDLGGETVFLEDSQNLGAGDTLNLGDAMGVTESDTDLGGAGSLLGQFDNLLNDVVTADLDP